jgi:hypothetical protein
MQYIFYIITALKFCFRSNAQASARNDKETGKLFGIQSYGRTYTW